MSTPAQPVPDNELIVRLIRAQDPEGGELLYQAYHRGLTFLARRYCPEQADDCVHDAIVAVLQQIKRGDLVKPEALPGYLVTIVKRIAWNKRSNVLRRETTGSAFDTLMNVVPDEQARPERAFEIKEQYRFLREGLKQLTPQQQEILTRFYLNAETPDAICQAMQLTETQFRLLKSRSKQKLHAAVQHFMRKPLATAHQMQIAAAV